MRCLCPHCNTVQVFSPETSGTMVLCPQCKKSFFADPIPADETEGYRSCPYCHERVRAGARKCRWCQSDLNPSQSSEVRSAKEDSAPLPPETRQAKEAGDQGEEELFNMTPTWKRLIAPIFVMALVFFGALPFLKQLDSLMYLVLALLFACAIWFFKRFLAIVTTHYRLTTQRLFVKSGLLTREEVEIQIGDISAAWLKQNLWEQIFRYGDVMLGTSATAGAEIAIEDIDNPREILDYIHLRIKGNPQ